MKRKLKKRITAFLLCMVLVVCNSVSILADEPVATAVESAETKEQEKATKEEKAPEATTAAKEKTTEKAPETTTAKKEETTTEKAPEATTAKKEEKTTEKAPETTTAKKEETTTEKAPEATTAKKEETTTEKAPEATTEKTDNTEASTATEKETAPTELIYENDQVTVKVSAISEGAIPAGATLKVVPIEKENSQTKTAYQEVEKKIQEKATQEKYDIAGFLAYDITLIDKDGKEVEPNSEVKVTMDYKQAVAPAMTEEIVNNTNVSVLHLEENAEGQVKEVVDMNQNGQLKTMDTTAQKEIQKTEFVTNSFSVYTVIWNYNQRSYKINIHYIDSNEESEINGKSGTVNLQNKKWHIIEEPVIPGYTYAKTVIAKDKSAALKAEKTNISQVKATYKEKKQWTIKYKNGDNGAEKKWKEDETNIYVIYNKNVVVNPDPGTPQEPEMEILGTPEHHKYIDYHENDDNYTLALDVSGKQGELTPVDILLIVDKSKSMTDPADEGKTRKDNVNSAINTLKEGLKENAPEGVDINLGVVTFSAAGAGTSEIRDKDSDYDISDNSEDAWSHGWKSLNNFSWELSGCTGGTNWQAGIRKGNTLLSQSENREKSRKYVIFLTDGEPTYRYLEESSTVTQGRGTYSSTSTNNYNYAVKEWNKSTYLKAANGRYVIDATAKGSNICKNFAAAMGGKRLMGSDKEELKTAVDTIVSQITKPVYKNVSITDTLSDYVQLEENPEFRVIAQDTETNEEKTLNSTDYIIKVYNGNNDEVYSGNTPNGANNVNWSDARKIELQLILENTKGVLEDKIKYSISFKIKVKEGAARQAVSKNNNQYPHIGDPDTDAPGNQTSSEKPGLYSNDNANTHLTYQENENEPTNVGYEKPVVQLKNLGEPVNFFLNLSSQILDTNGNTQGQAPDHFTTSVSGNKSASKSVQGIGVAINDDLRVIVPEDHNHAAIGQETYPVIGGDTKENALVADARIRDLQNGTTGNVSGTTEEYYKIVNGKGEGEFPTDEEIFTYIRENWEAQGVNKGKDITVNGVAINKDYLTTDNFTIRWYVFKDQSDDEYWHIDGILVPKGGILTVTKTFPNQVIADNVKENFSIAVTGNFLTGDESATISKNLAQAEKSLTNEDGSVTYSWQFAIFDMKYTVSESGYMTTGINWNYDSTDWSYTDARGETTNGTTRSRLINTTISAKDTTPVTQTFAFHNHYNASLNLKKVSAATGNPEISGAKFNLSEKSENGWTQPIEIVVNKNNTAAKLNNLQTGKVYKLQEVEAPDAHVLLQEEIYFIVEASGAIKLCDKDGKLLSNEKMPTMWELNETGTELTIKNEMLYELPSTGGNGIYWYTIGGMALMMGAALILYKDKRKRMVLLKR